jgi:ectoine hydroxylase-related dioxygenase (phytanoyl-CoA dioxygenase family)
VSFLNPMHTPQKNEEPTLHEGNNCDSSLYTVSSPEITPHDLERYHEDGAILIKGLLDNQDFEPLKVELLKRLELLEARYCENQSTSNPTVSEVIPSLSDISQRLLNLSEKYPEAQGILYDGMGHTPSIHQLSSHPQIQSVVKKLLSPTIEVFPKLILLMSVPQKTWHLAPWHQDWYYNQGPYSTLTLYAPLQKTNSENGSLLLALGEHQNGPQPHEEASSETTTGEKKLITKWRQIPSEVHNTFSRVVSSELEVGDVLLFNSLVPHSARVNQSPHIRFVLNLRYRDLEDAIYLSDGWRINENTQAKQAMARKEPLQGKPL